MKISVIIPTFDRAHTLKRALDSVLQQTLPADEIIVVDDGSTDETADLMRTEYPNVVYLRQDNAGVSRARNTGINAARNDWLALLDSDDEWHPRKLERQTEALRAQPQHRLCHTDEIWIRNGRRVNQMNKHAKRGGRIFQHCLPLCAISPSSVLMHRGLLDETGLFDETLPACEDYDLWLRITANHPVLYLDEALITKYGGHDDQLSRKHWGMDRFRIQALEKIINRGDLKPDDRRAALETLEQKLDILLTGARKHSNEEILRCYTMKQHVYKRELARCLDA
ncbi:MAG TPA: glycosyltransferase family A protein [Gammaproteobacteria bacterium]